MVIQDPDTYLVNATEYMRELARSLNGVSPSFLFRLKLEAEYLRRKALGDRDPSWVLMDALVEAL